jgi:hypothetical protein
MSFSGTWGNKMSHEKNLKQKSRVTFPLKKAVTSKTSGYGNNYRYPRRCDRRRMRRRIRYRRNR